MELKEFACKFATSLENMIVLHANNQRRRPTSVSAQYDQRLCYMYLSSGEHDSLICYMPISTILASLCS